MITRRDLLRSCGLVTASVGLDACALGKTPTTPPGALELRQLCQRLCSREPNLFEEDVRGQFRTLECLVMVLSAAPSTERALAGEVKRRFWRLHGKLAAAKYSSAVTETWRMFYELTSRLHERRNDRARKSRLPVYAYNGHQHAARLWLDENARRQTRGPLLHFDSHRDMRALSEVSGILRATKRLSAGGRARKKALSELRRLIRDPATPVTAGVLGGAVTDVVWAFPRWTYAKEILQRPVFYGLLPGAKVGPAGYRLLHDRRQDPEGALPRSHFAAVTEVGTLMRGQRRAMRHRRSFHLSQLRTYPHNPDTHRILCHAIPKGGFILDIDTDYLLSIDYQSGFSRPSGPVRDRTARSTEYHRRLGDARQLIDERLAELKLLLVELREVGRVPTVITLADSTYMPFATTLAGRGYWEYMPWEFAAYAHWRVRQLLAEVYRQHGIDAGT